jgi:hypothetical protein
VKELRHVRRGAGAGAELGTGGSVQARAWMRRCCSATVRGGSAQGGSRAARGGRRRPLRRKQRTRSGGTANCSWRIWRWPGAKRPRSSRRRRSGYGVTSRKEGGKAKAATGCDELRGATVQPDTASSLHPCGGQGRSNAAQVRRAAEDQRRW